MSSITGIIEKIGEPKVGRTQNGKSWTKWSVFVNNLETGDTAWISDFGSMPGIFQEAFDHKLDTPPMELRVGFELKNGYRNYNKEVETVTGPLNPRKGVLGDTTDYTKGQETANPPRNAPTSAPDAKKDQNTAGDAPFYASEIEVQVEILRNLKKIIEMLEKW